MRPYVIAVTVGYMAFACADATEPLPPTYQATVSTQQARFLFPVATQPVWEWNLASTRDNTLEYMWAVELQNGDSAYQFGYFRWKGSLPRSGDLERLLQAGQHSVFALSSAGGSLVPTARVTVLHDDPYVAVIIDDAQTLRLLFSERPSQSVFRTVIPGEPVVIQVVDLQYE